MSAPAALVGPTGYTEAFGSLPAAADWTTVSIGGASTDYGTPAQLDAAVQATTAAGVSGALVADTGNPPGAVATARWSSTGLYVQTRPTGVGATLLMCKLVNNLGTLADRATISYDLTTTDAASEQVPGLRVFYSLTGAANSWTNIPTLTAGLNGRLSATINVPWPSGGTLYVLWADDNGDGFTDGPCQIDNFSVTAVSAVLVPVAITNSPRDQTVDELKPVTFTVGVVGNPYPTFQWYTNGAPVPEATNQNFTIASTPLSYDGFQFHVVAQNVISNVTYSATSSVASLIVNPDLVPPALLNAQASGLNQVVLYFSERLAEASATNVAHYTITSAVGGLTVSSAILGASQTNVFLNVSTMSDGVTYTVIVSNVTDRAAAANPVAPGSSAQFLASQLTSVDLGNPAVRGSSATLPDGFRVEGGGTDIGGSSDQFHFVYRPQAADFDIQVRVAGLSLSNPYAEAGLMARATLTANSPFVAVLTTPSLAGCHFAWRTSLSGAAGMSGSFPVNHPYTYLRLQRSNGTNFTGYASFDGQTWTRLGSVTIPTMPDPLYFGLAVAGHSASVPAVAEFRDLISVTGTPVVGPPVLATEPLGPCSRKTGLVISEIMYHPRTVPAPGGGRNLALEFIEIYNSQPFFENIGGYSITGDINFTFPPGTVMEAGSFLVLAKVPADVQTHYGLANVLGYGREQYVTNVVGTVTNVLTNIVNSLNNAAGTLRLRNRQGAVLLEVAFSSNPPWPTAADGAGHSLVLARPSYGEGDPRAWAASDQIDGSPGRLETVVAEPARNVVINEFLANSDPPLEDFIELYNHGNTDVDLSGCWLSDDPSTNKFRIPDGTILPARGHVAFTQTQLGFALSSEGEKVLLVNSNRTRVLDGIRFEAQSAGVSFGRSPDGSSTWRELAERTPGAPNSPYKDRPIVINEIMYAPISGKADDEFIELYNKSTNAVDVSGWRFADGISFTIPEGTVIPPGGYLVVARNRTNILANYYYLDPALVVGDYSGNLRNRGERVALAMRELQVTTNLLGQVFTNAIYPVVNEVTYGTSERWGVWADGGGSSLELIDPRSDNRLADNWADSDETQKSQWATFQLTGTIGETLGSPVNDNLQIFLLGVGECLVDNVALTNSSGVDVLASVGNFEGGLSGWTPQGSHDQSTGDGPGYQSLRSLRVRANSRGDNGANRIRSPAFSGVGGNVGLSAAARWLRGHPEVLLRIHGGGLEMTCQLPVPKNLGTPGLRNSRAVANAGPAISEVTHRPILPAANEPVVVTARAHDPDGLTSVQLQYRVDPASVFSTLPMRDDGTGGDAVAGDGIYSATLPGQPAGTVVAFYVQATDAAVPAVQNIFPADALTRNPPNDAPSHELVVRFGDTVMPGAFPTYHLWLTANTSNRWYNRDRLNNAPLDGTFVYNGVRLIYNMKPLYAGSPWHRGQMSTGPSGSQRVDYAPVFPDDDMFLGAKDATWANPGNPSGGNFSDRSMQSEQTSYLIFEGINVHYNYRRYVHIFVNGSQRSRTGDMSGNHLIEDCQQPNSDVVEEWYSEDPDGELFKIEDWFEFPDNGYDFTANNDADLERRTTVINNSNQLNTATYRFKFRRRAVATWESYSDYTNFFALVDAVSPASNPNISPITNIALVESYANIEQWMRIFACQHTVGNWDAYGYNRGKNGYFYKPVNGRFEHLTWDIDFTMGIGGDGATTDLFGTTDPRITAMWNTPHFLRYYWRAYQDIVDGPLNNAYTDPILDAKAAAFTANGITYDSGQLSTIKGYVSSRRGYLQGRLNTVAASFTVNQTGVINSSSNLVTFTGTAPVGAVSIRVNGRSYPITWTGVTTWSMAVPVTDASNQLVFAAYDRFGSVTNTPVTNTVNYLGPGPAPDDAVVFNEIMFHPLVPGAEYVELYNTSTNFTFDLSGWFIDGLNYTFPPGTLLRPRNYLVLAKNRWTFALAYGDAIPVFDIFPGNLQSADETLTLIKPGPTPAQDVVMDKVRYDSEPPWPTNASGTGSSLQLLDPRQDNSRVGNWYVRYDPPTYSPAIYIPGSTNSGWQMVSITGIMRPLRTLLLYLDTPGEVYIDDLWLCLGTNAGTGTNYVRNGDFELPLTNYFIGTNYAGSALSTAEKHGGNSSLRMVCTFADTANTNRMINQVINPAPPVNAVCTLSFWYLITTNAANLTVRFQGTTPNSGHLLVTTNVQPVIVPPVYIPPQLLSPATNYATPAAANSIVTNLPPIPPLWINEVQPDNLSGLADAFGHRVPWIELYNAGPETVSLDGLFLANTLTNLTQWAFPAWATIAPGEFMVLFADGVEIETTSNELHTSFLLDSGSGVVALSRLYNGEPQVLDYLEYRDVGLDRSFGDAPDGQPFTRQPFHFPTPRGTNDASAPPVTLVLNEFMAANARTFADPADGRFDDWFEIFNPGSNAVNLEGYYLTDTAANRFKFRVPAGFAIPPRGYLLVWADEQVDQNNTNAPDLHANFKLERGGEDLILTAPDGRTLDAIVGYPAQTSDVSYGRFPDAAASFYFMTNPTPRAPNFIPDFNAPPELQAIGDLTLPENHFFTYRASATDSDGPAQTLTFSLDPGAPAGATITPDGLFRWRPAEEDGPGVYYATIRVTDSGSPPRDDAETVRLIVTEVNQPPYFINTLTKWVRAGDTLAFPTAADRDWPPQVLHFTLENGLPAGASVHPDTGVFSWTPTVADVGTHAATVRAVDTGNPVLGGLHTYQIVVLPAGEPLVLIEFGRTTNAIRMQWQTTAGKNYRLEYKENLGDPWMPLSADTPGNGNPLMFDDPLAGRPQRFYRVVEWQ